MGNESVTFRKCLSSTADPRSSRDEHPLLPGGMQSLPTIAKSNPSRTRFFLCFGILTICVLAFSRPSVENLSGSDWVPHLTAKRPSAGPTESIDRKSVV